MSRVEDNQPTGVDPDRGGSGDQGHELVRQEAVRQLERKRHFHMEVVVSAVGMLVLVVIWAATEYHNAGGWPSRGFSQSSGIHDEWNYWIVYPLGAWVLILAARAWHVYGRKPISEGEIQREIERMSGRR